MIGKVQGYMTLSITDERIELRTLADVKYAKYRLMRLKTEYPERFQQNYPNVEDEKK